MEQGLQGGCDVGSQTWKEGIPRRRNSVNGHGIGKRRTRLEEQLLFQESWTPGLWAGCRAILRAFDCWDEKLRLKRNHGRGETGHGKLSSRKSQPWDKWACFTEVCSAALCQVNERMRKESNLARGLLWRCSRGSPLGLCFLICKADFYSSPTCPQNGGENQMHQCACDCQPGWQRRRHSYRWLWLLPC